MTFRLAALCPNQWRYRLTLCNEVETRVLCVIYTTVRLRRLGSGAVVACGFPFVPEYVNQNIHTTTFSVIYYIGKRLH
jgi:hypothetical protein